MPGLVYVPGKGVVWESDIQQHIRLHNEFDPEFWKSQWFNDGTESSATSAQTEDTNDAIDVGSGDIQRHLRCGVQEIGAGSVAGAATDDWELEFDIDGGGYNPVTASSTGVQADTGSGLTEGGATTERMTAGTGTWNAGEQEEDDGQIVDYDLGADNYTELVYALLFVAADFTGGEVVTFRLTRNGAANQVTNTVVPQSTVSKTGGGLSIPVAMNSYRQHRQSGL